MTAVPLGIYGGYVRAGAGTCSFLIEEDGFYAVLDMGSGSLSALESHISLDCVSAIMISHEHGDHIADLETASFGRLISMQLGTAKDPIPVYGPQIPWLSGRIESRGSMSYNEVSDSEELAIGPFSVTPYRMDHDCTCFGYLVKGRSSSLFYSADTSFSPETAKRIPHADMMLLECSIYDRYGSGRQFGHMNGEEAAAFLNIAKPSRALLVHLPCYGENNELLDSVRRHYSGNADLAECGRKYII